MEELLKVDSVVKGDIVRRLNRFVVEVFVNGKRERVHINNTGRLLEYMVEGREAFLRPLKKPGKMRYRLFAVEDEGGAALIDTQLQMEAFRRAFYMGLIGWLKGYTDIKSNPRLGNSVLDFLLLNHDELYLEVKSAVLREGRFAKYPDCPTLRGRRHIEELIEAKRRGIKTGVVFIAALPNVEAFTPHDEGDPEIRRLLKVAMKEKVLIRAVQLIYSPVTSAVYLLNPELRVQI